MNHVPTLPIDVQEIVIDESADDVRTLRQCALTCRDWLPRSRFYLLSAICISTQEDIYSFCDYLDAHPERRSLVRSITMAPDVAEKRPACLVGTFPVSLLSRLPKLQGWALRNRLPNKDTLNVSYHSTTLQHLRTSSPIVDLRLTALNFVSRHELLRFIASFSQLRHLRCDIISFDRPDHLDSGRPKPRGLRKLRLSTLLMPHSCRDMVRVLLESTISTLERLTITLDSKPCSESQGNINGVVLSSMPGLHSLTFGIGIVHRAASLRANVVTPGDPQCSTTMAKALDGAHIPQVKSLSVSIPEPSLLDDTTAQRLKSMILGMKLQSFTVNVERPHPTSSWVCPISRAFRFMKKFRRFKRDGSFPEVVFSNVDATFFYEQLHGKRTTMSPNGRWVASSIEDGVVLWDLMSKNSSLRTFRLPPFFPLSTGEISHMAFSPDGGRIIVAGDGGAANVWDVKRRRCLSVIPLSDPIAVAWSPRCIVLEKRQGIISTYNPSTYRWIGSHVPGDGPWRYDMDMYTNGPGGYRRPRAGLFFSPDYRWMAASYPAKWSGYVWALWMVGEDGTLTEHRMLSNTTETPQASERYYYHEQVAFTSDSTRMAVVSLDLELCVWDVASATLLLSINPTLGIADSLVLGKLNISFLPGSQHLLVVRGEEATIEVWDGTTGRFLHRLVLEGRSSGDVRWSRLMAPSFSPCGRYVVSSSFNARGPLIWRTEDGSMVSRGY